MSSTDRQAAIQKFRAAKMEHRNAQSNFLATQKRHDDIKKFFEITNNQIKSLQSCGMNVADFLRKLTDDTYIVKTSYGSRHIVGCIESIDKDKLKPGGRVALDNTTLTIMKILPRETDPSVHRMSVEDPGNISFNDIGGLSDQLRQIREVVELPLTNPELFVRVGVQPPKGVLLYGPPGTGKTLLARAIAATTDATFLKVVASAIIDKYIGESERMIREMFAYAKDHEPCIIFMDEIDAIGQKRTGIGHSHDRDTQRTLMELLAHLDGFDPLGKTKMVMATNRPDTLDAALLRPGRLDRKIEIPLPNSTARLEIIKIHAQNINKQGDIDYEPIVKLSDGFNGADLRNVCTEAGMFAIRDQRMHVVQEDFIKGVRKIAENKKLEGSLHYEKV